MKLPCTVLLLGSMSAAAASPNLEGMWNFRERYCIDVNDQRWCGRGVDAFMFSGTIAYYRPAGDAGWSVVGTLTTSHRHVAVRISREGVGMLVRQLVGADVTELLHAFSFVFTGIVHPGRITAGHERLSLDLRREGTIYRIRSTGRFTARRTGDVCCLPESSGLEANSTLGGHASSPRHGPAATGPLSTLSEILGAAYRRSMIVPVPRPPPQHIAISP
jgi:hypothetical protein